MSFDVLSLSLSTRTPHNPGIVADVIFFRYITVSISPDNSCDSDSSLAKAPFLILTRQSGPLRGTCLAQTFCLSQGQLKPFGCLDLHAPAPTGGNFMNNVG